MPSSTRSWRRARRRSLPTSTKWEQASTSSLTRSAARASRLSTSPSSWISSPSRVPTWPSSTCPASPPFPSENSPITSTKSPKIWRWGISLSHVPSSFVSFLPTRIWQSARHWRSCERSTQVDNVRLVAWPKSTLWIVEMTLEIFWRIKKSPWGMATWASRIDARKMWLIMFRLRKVWKRKRNFSQPVLSIQLFLPNYGEPNP